MRKINVNQLSWQCRRGMLELDLFLQPFLKNVFDDLDESEQYQFAELLSSNDQELLSWLMNYETCPYPEWQPIIQKIRDYAHQYSYQS